MRKEIELKFEVTPRDLRKLRGARVLRRKGLKEENLVSVYFDTPKHKLARNDVTLRVRLCEKNGQTLSQLCENLDMARQSATQHLGILEDANLVIEIRRWAARCPGILDSGVTGLIRLASHCLWRSSVMREQQDGN
jgi:adenylate cyclase class IV